MTRASPPGAKGRGASAIGWDKTAAAFMNTPMTSASENKSEQVSQQPSPEIPALVRSPRSPMLTPPRETPVKALLFYAQPYLAAAGRYVHARAAIPCFERQTCTGSVPRFVRLGSETIVDIAADGLDIKIRLRRTCKLQLDIAAHGFTFHLRVRRRCEGRRNIPGNGFESSSRHGSEREVRRAAHRSRFDLCSFAGEHNVAADGLDLDELRGLHIQVNIAADRIGMHIAPALAANIAAHRSQLQSASYRGYLQVGTHHRGGY